jgi:hypothetical protein
MASMKRKNQGYGEIKYKTKNCKSCDFDMTFNNRNICARGITLKYLEEESKRKYKYHGKESLKNNSLKYVLFAKKNNLFEKSKGIDAMQLKLF